MVALYRCGRQAEATEVFQQYRRALSHELGLDPSPALRELEASILSRDPKLDLAGAQRSTPQRNAARAWRPASPIFRSS
jgi:DNA-binding SARP family transcriptional activator